MTRRTCTRIWGPERRWWLTGEDARRVWLVWEFLVQPTAAGRRVPWTWADNLEAIEAAGAANLEAGLVALSGPSPVPPDVEFAGEMLN